MTSRRKLPVVVRPPKTERGRAFLEALLARVPEPWDEPQPIDHRYAELASEIDCHSSPSKLALIEAAASTTRDGEVYLEVGSLAGATLVAAAKTNPALRAVAIDDFSQFDATRRELLNTLVRYGIEERITLIESDYRVALAESLPPVAVYVYDGPHDYMDQYLALELVATHLVDGALVIVDDTSWRHVARANTDFLRSHPRLSLLCDLPSRQLQDHRWWNGLQVLEYVRDAGSDGARDLRHVANRLLYALIQPMAVYRLFYPARGRVLEWWEQRRTTD